MDMSLAVPFFVLFLACLLADVVVGGRHAGVAERIVGALAWGAISLIVLDEYLESGATGQLNQIWFLMYLLWLQFGFAGVFQSVRNRGAKGLPSLLLVIILPPLLLHFIIFLAI